MEEEEPSTCQPSREIQTVAGMVWTVNSKLGSSSGSPFQGVTRLLLENLMQRVEVGSQGVA